MTASEHQVPTGMAARGGYGSRLGRRLRDVRERSGLSAADVERLSNGALTAHSIRAWERGARSISAAKLIRLAELYRVRPAALLPDGEANPPLTAPAVDRGGWSIDLNTVRQISEASAALGRYADSIAAQGNASHAARVPLHESDLDALALIYGRPVRELLTVLSGLHVLQPSA